MPDLHRLIKKPHGWSTLHVSIGLTKRSPHICEGFSENYLLQSILPEFKVSNSCAESRHIVLEHPNTLVALSAKQATTYASLMIVIDLKVRKFIRHPTTLIRLRNTTADVALPRALLSLSNKLLSGEVAITTKPLALSYASYMIAALLRAVLLIALTPATSLDRKHTIRQEAIQISAQQIVVWPARTARATQPLIYCPRSIRTPALLADTIRQYSLVTVLLHPTLSSQHRSLRSILAPAPGVLTAKELLVTGWNELISTDIALARLCSRQSSL